MSVAPTDCSLDDRPIRRRNDVICFGAPITESSATRLRTKRGFRRIGKSERRLQTIHRTFSPYFYVNGGTIRSSAVLDKLSVMVGDVPDGNHRHARFGVRSGVTAFDTVERIALVPVLGRRWRIDWQRTNRGA